MFRYIPLLLLSLCVWAFIPALQAAESDSAIVKRIQVRLARSSLRHDTVQFRVVGGVATIEGWVKNVQRKGVATRFARESGAAEVVNLLKVNDGKPQEPPKLVRVLP